MQVAPRETIAGSCPLSLGQIPSLGSLGALVKNAKNKVLGLGQISFDQKVSAKQLAQERPLPPDTITCLSN